MCFVFFKNCVFFLKKFSEPLSVSIDPICFSINQNCFKIFKEASVCFNQSNLIFDQSKIVKQVFLKSEFDLFKLTFQKVFQTFLSLRIEQGSPSNFLSFSSGLFARFSSL